MQKPSRKDDIGDYTNVIYALEIKYQIFTLRQILEITSLLISDSVNRDELYSAMNHLGIVNNTNDWKVLTSDWTTVDRF